jgi:hypothetical protein
MMGLMVWKATHDAPKPMVLNVRTHAMQQMTAAVRLQAQNTPQTALLLRMCLIATQFYLRQHKDRQKF